MGEEYVSLLVQNSKKYLNELTEINLDQYNKPQKQKEYMDTF